MTHKDHVYLLKKAIHNGRSLWADFGSGEGTFTLALRDLAGEDSEIYSVDKNINSLAKQKTQFQTYFPDSKIHFLEANFTKPLDLPPLDGILMANSLHYIKNQITFLKNIKQYLKPNGKLIIVEYNVDRGNIWIPHPLSYKTFIHLSKEAGYENTSFLEKVPSQWLEEIYSAQTFV